jgi:hypothetical protein
MANKVTIAVLGGKPKTFDSVNTVQEAKKLVKCLDYMAVVNGEAQDDDFALDSYSFVALAPPVKGGSK